MQKMWKAVVIGDIKLAVKRSKVFNKEYKQR